jgi:hypothetical protein
LHTLLVEKEAMAPRTLIRLAHGMASDGRIRLGEPEFTNVDGLAPMFAFAPGQDLHTRVLDSMVYVGHTLKMAPNGHILEFTYIEEPTPSFTFDYGYVLHLGDLRPMVHDKLARGMTLNGHFHLGNLEFTQIIELESRSKLLCRTSRPP